MTKTTKYLQTIYNLLNDQKFQFMHKVLQKDVHRYFLESVKPNVETYREAANLIEKENNSAVRQTRTKIQLSGLQVERFVENDVDTAAALAVV